MDVGGSPLVLEGGPVGLWVELVQVENGVMEILLFAFYIAVTLCAL